MTEPFQVPERPLSKSARTTLITFLALALIVGFIAFRMISSFLLPMLMGAILSLMLHGLYCRWSHGQRSKLTALAITGGMILLIMLPLGIFATMGVRQGIMVGKSLSQTGISFNGLADKVSHLSIIQSIGLTPEEIESNLQDWARSGGTILLTTVLALASHLPSLVFELILIALSCFFFLTDGPQFLLWAKEKIPMDQSVRSRLATSFQDTSISVIWATLGASGAQALVMVIAFLSLGIPGVILAAGATFLLAWIPMVGSSPVWVLGALYLLLNGAIIKMFILIAAGLSMGILDNFVRTLILRGRSEMHPLVSLVAIFGGIEMFGIMGVFLGPVIAAMIISILDVWPGLGKSLGLLEERK